MKRKYLLLFSIATIFLNTVRLFITKSAIPNYIPIITDSLIVISVSIMILVFSFIFTRFNNILFTVLTLLSFSLYFHEASNYFPFFYNGSWPLVVFHLLMLAQLLTSLVIIIFTFKLQWQLLYLAAVFFYEWVLRVKFSDKYILPLLAMASFIVFLSGFFFKIILAQHKRNLSLSNELSDLRAETARHEYLSSLTTAIAGIVHEIGNPLTPMYGNLEMLSSRFRSLIDILSCVNLTKQQKDEIETVKNDAESILLRYSEGFDRIIGVIADVKKTFRSRQDRREMENIHSIAEAVMRLTSLPAGKDVTIRNDISSNLLYNCNYNDLFIIFSNLLRNAAESIISAGEIILESEEKDGGMLLSVRDNGSAVGLESKEKIFDEFYTTKENYGNLGMGLPLVKKIIKKYGGKISFRSSEDEFKAFIIFLPQNHTG